MVDDLPESFAEHPVTLGEVKAHRSESASDWTPRDALIDLLRRIDKGEHEITDLIVCFRDVKDGGVRTRFAMAGKHGSLMCLGLMSRASYMVNDS